MKQPVLIIAYYWPPAGGPGVQRWLKFVTYLPDHGYDVTVVIPENPDYPVTDDSLLSQIPSHVTFIKVPINEPSRWSSALSRNLPAGRQGVVKNLQKGILPKNPGIVQKSLIWLRGNLFIPDARVGWKSRVLKAIHPYLLKHKSPTVITTGPPHSVHLVGLELKQKYSGFKWLADFRDPWTTIGYHKHLQLGERAQKKHVKLEQQVLDTTNLLLVTSPSTGKEFASKTSTPIQLITNGYDIPEASSTIQPKGKFTLSHVGTLLSDRNPQLLWESLADLCRDDAIFKSRLELQLAGNVSNEVLESIESYGLQSNLKQLGYVSHQQAVDLMYDSQCLLLIEINSEDTKSIIPGKIFEYFASRRPIIAIGPQDADIEQLIIHTHSGRFFNYSEKEQLKSYLLNCYERYVNGNNEGNTSDSITMYRRKNLTAVLHKTIQYAWE